MSRHRVTAQCPAATALALWLAIAGVSLGFTAAPALAEETEAAETPVADPGQQPEAPEVAEGEAATEPDPEPDATPSPARPRSRVIRPDPSDVDDALSESGFDNVEAPATRGAERALDCVAGCSGGLAPDGGPPPPVSGTRNGTAAEPAARPTGGLVCLAGC